MAVPQEKQKIFQARMTAKGPFTVPVPNVQSKPGETVPRRHPWAVDELTTKLPGNISTTYELVKVSAEKYGNARAMGSRKLVKTHHETKMVRRVVDGKEQEVEKQWTYFELGPYEYMTYTQYERLTLQLGAGLRNLGLAKNDRVCLYAATSSQWLAMSHAATSQSMTVVTAYDTLGEEGLRHSMMATRAKCVFLDPHLLPTLIKVLRDATDIQFIVLDTQNQVKQEHVEQLQKAYGHIRIMNFDELRKIGDENSVDAVPPTPEDLCCIMYTSGSTGTPKGVPLKHKNVIGAVAGISVVAKPYIGPGDGLLVYLPLAHILEFVLENVALHLGVTMGYGSPKTLSDTSVRNCSGDVKEFKPSIMAGVPAVWEAVKKGIIAKISARSLVTRCLFWGAMWAKPRMLRRGVPGVGVVDAMVFQKLREATGGRLKLCMNGGGPIAKETQEFISMAVCPMIIGYGLTETAAQGCLMDPAQWNTNTMGAMPCSVEIKLVDFPDAGYHVTNRPNPQGEVWIRGPSVMDGYYEDDKGTAEAMTEDGWFKTGDIGEFDARGHLKLIDRKKNLVKTLNGEYIALEKLECVYRSAPVVANICVYADEQQVRPVAIIVPAEPALRKLASQIGVSGESLEELVHTRRLQDAVLRELQAAGRAGGLSGIEIISGVVLSDEEWTPQNNMVTAAQKLQRRAIVAMFAKEVAQAYSMNQI